MSSIKKNNYAFEIRFVDDKIVQVFDIAAKRQNESSGLPTEYLQEDVLKGQLRYSKLVGSTASPVIESTDEYQHQVTTKRSENRRSTQRHTFMMGGGGGGGGDYNRKVKSNYNNSRDHRTVSQRPSSPKSPKPSRLSIISSTLPVSPTNVVSPSLSASPTEAASLSLSVSPPLQPVSPSFPPVTPSIRALSPSPQPLSPSPRALSPSFHPVSPISQPLSPQLPPVSPLQEMSPPLISPSLTSSTSSPLQDISLSPPMSPMSPSSLQAVSPPLSPNTPSPPPSVSPNFLPPQPARVSSSIKYDNHTVNNNFNPRNHYQYNQTIDNIQMNRTSSIIPSPIVAVTTAQQHPETYYEDLAMVDSNDYSSKKNFQQLDEEKMSSNNGKRACCIIQ